jgi:hypothetical protein
MPQTGSGIGGAEASTRVHRVARRILRDDGYDFKSSHMITRLLHYSKVFSSRSSSRALILNGCNTLSEGQYYEM